MKRVLISLCFLVLCSVSFAGPKDDLEGYYKADMELMKKAVEKRIASLSEERKDSAKAKMDILLKTASRAVIQFTDKEVNMWGLGEPNQTKTYTIEKVEGNTLTVNVDGVVSGVAIEKDSIQFTSGRDRRFLKIEEKEAKEMIAKVEAENKKKEGPSIEEKTPVEGGME